ncbi:MAG: Holliday junction branch migration protein RuvA [Firmicutes bacterium]|nr:Holliday junction branch migration protein RuvA [Bacillota bacterium]
MYNYIKGKIIDCDKGILTLECGNIGYLLNVSNATIVNLPLGSEATVYTYLQFSENTGINLYGFYSRQERDMFLKLLTISGIGAKAAMSILSGMPLAALSISIASGNATRLKEIKGIGAKTAQRIVLELKDKVSALTSLDDDTSADAPLHNFTPTSQIAIEALIHLGYKKAEAQKAVSAIYAPNLTEEELITLALSNNR